MFQLDLALRSGNIALLLLLGILIWRAPIGLEGRLSVLAICLSETAFLLVTTAVPVPLPISMMAGVMLLASFMPAAITWLIVTIYVDAPMRRWPWIMAGLATSVAWHVNVVIPGSVPFAAALAALLYAALFVLALWTARDDLVERRCQARPGFALAIAALASFLTGVQALGLLEVGTIAWSLAAAAGVFLITLAFALWLLSPDADRWPGAMEPARSAQAPDMHDGIEDALIARIEAMMAAGIWREEGLTIGDLAHKLALPEHRVRRAINQRLGYRNFSSFINGARIEASRTTLSDPARMNMTMLEIAYDVGFASVGPFNRAFRAEVGHSPTEYRRLALSDKFADSNKPSPKPVNLH